MRALHIALTRLLCVCLAVHYYTHAHVADLHEVLRLGGGAFLYSHPKKAVKRQGPHSDNAWDEVSGGCVLFSLADDVTFEYFRGPAFTRPARITLRKVRNPALGSYSHSFGQLHVAGAGVFFQPKPASQRLSVCGWG